MTDNYKKKVENLAVLSIRSLITPAVLKRSIPINRDIVEHVVSSRQTITNILSRKDKRFLLVIGPCSIHDKNAAIDYAKRLKKLAEEVSDSIYVVMRVYFEKPRTTIGWKGLINDPDLNNSYDVNKGLHLARQILLEINKLGLPAAVEFLDPVTPEYIADLVSWGAIGARTTESQIHRNLASGLSMPIGFKNGTSGNTKIAIDAVYAAYHSNQYLGINNDGVAAIINTTGNKNTHVILRGGSETGPNYGLENIKTVIEHLKSLHLMPSIMIDCSHGNSNKDYTKQSVVLEAVIQQLQHNYGNYIIGAMIESFIKEGNQAITLDLNKLEYGKSITDSCISWNETLNIVLNLARQIRRIRQVRLLELV